MKKDEKDEKILICLRADRPVPVRSKIQHCQECGHDVWVSPASLIAAGADARIVCTVCLDKILAKLNPEEVFELSPPSEGQLREVRKALR